MRDIKGYKGIYTVNRNGEVFNIIKNTKLSGSINSRGYINIGLSKNGKRKMYTLHRLVAEAFIPNTENKPQINHINGIKIDNRVDNLEWVNNSENQLHSYRTLNRKSNKIALSKKIIQLDMNNNFIREWDSIMQASIETGFDRGNISKACNGKIKYHKNYKWKFK